MKEGFDRLDQWLQEGKDEGPYLLGTTPYFSDFAITGIILWMKKVWGEERARSGKIFQHGRTAGGPHFSIVSRNTKPLISDRGKSSTCVLLFCRFNCDHSNFALVVPMVYGAG
jgi:hypothetical protein